MDIPNTATLPQLILTMTLFILLISWLVIFAYLALRPGSDKQVDLMEHTAPRSAIKASVIQTHPVTPRASHIHPVTQPTPVVTVNADPAHEIVLGGGCLEHSPTSSGQI